MHVIRARNVHQALPIGVAEMIARGIPTPSRNGDVLMIPEPVTTVYAQPCERVIFWPERDANPFFHLFEALWMLAGRNDVAFVKRFAKRMATFSDDGKTLHGAYGKRWRSHWQFDQLGAVIALLKADPRTRRAVLTMWDPAVDLDVGATARDIPCNQQCFFWNLHGRLQMTLTCRSNDIIWGAYGANAVHFSMLQEYVAGKLGWEVGTFYQISNNYHAYLDTFNKVRALSHYAPRPALIRDKAPCPYSAQEVTPYVMIPSPLDWDRDLALFMEDPEAVGFINPFFRRVVKPMWFAHKTYRDKLNPLRFKHAYEIIDQCEARDWQRAAREWLLRRESGVRAP